MGKDRARREEQRGNNLNTKMTFMGVFQCYFVDGSNALFRSTGARFLAVGFSILTQSVQLHLLIDLVLEKTEVQPNF